VATGTITRSPDFIVTEDARQFDLEVTRVSDENIFKRLCGQLDTADPFRDGGKRCSPDILPSDGPPQIGLHNQQARRFHAKTI
jgi:hypothetical protein